VGRMMEGNLTAIILFVALGVIGILLIVLSVKGIIPESWSKPVWVAATALVTLGLFPLISFLVKKKKKPAPPPEIFHPEAASETDRESLNEDARTIDEKLAAIDKDAEDNQKDADDSKSHKQDDRCQITFHHTPHFLLQYRSVTRAVFSSSSFSLD